MQGSDAEKEEAEKQFTEIAEAYEVLSDDEKRGKYDRGEEVFPNQGGGQPQGHPFAHHFQGAFQGRWRTYFPLQFWGLEMGNMHNSDL